MLNRVLPVGRYNIECWPTLLICHGRNAVSIVTPQTIVGDGETLSVRSTVSKNIN